MAHKVLIVDDDPFNLDLLQQELTEQHYVVENARDGEEGMQKVASFLPDVILLDYMMPKMSGLEVVKCLKQDERFKGIPVVLLTAKGSLRDKIEGLDAGADDYVAKPFDAVELLARVRSMMRIKQMRDALEEGNRTLASKVRAQVEELQRLNRFKRYFAPQVAEAILKSDEELLFKVHRREITVVFLDLRGFTAFSDSAEPEEVMELLRTYHAEMGRLIFAFEGTLERFAGDGIMVFFNDPVPFPDHAKRAVCMALKMQATMKALRAQWQKEGHDLDLGIGLASGYATLGTIGFEGRMDYAALGNVTNLTSRLSDAARGGQILTNKRTLSRLEDVVEAEPLDELTLKGFARPVPTFNILRLRE
jgi:adenylate cyclase